MTANVSGKSFRAGDGTLIATTAAAGFAGTVLACLAVLHAVSPEFDPSWRMVSEYANGTHGWLLSAMFACWALSSWMLAYALYPLAPTLLAKIGVFFLAVAGLGEAMAAMFDINHPLHMLAAIFGMNGLPIAAMLIGVTFGRAGTWGGSRRTILWLSNLTWISIVLMAAAMAVFFSTLSSAGVDIGPNSKPLTTLPPEVVAFGGWANRFLIVAYCLWAIAVALRLRRSLLEGTV